MAHACQTLVFRCMDFRLKPTVMARLLGGIGYAEGEYDLVSLAGSAKNILLSRSRTLFKIPLFDLLAGWVVSRFILLQIQLAVRLHKVSAVVVLHHDDCGAYGITDPVAEHRIQAQDLAKIRELIASKTGLPARTYLIRGTASGNLSLEECK